ncbi:MAG: YraN family protein [Gemmatimonadetes bacterium]|nr:YraN family protein [Gemmatimonadota bacterium]
MDDTRHDVGRRGEGLAAEYLAERGWRVLARNYRAGPREIDIVAARDGVVAFVEVKTRATRTGGAALEPIRRLKQRAVVAAARRWIHENGRRGCVYRFDAIGVELRGDRVVIEHLPDAWRP